MLAYNEATGETGYYPVTDVWVHEDPVTVYLTIDGEVIETTPEHPFYTEDGEWVPASELEVGDEIQQADGSTGEVEAVEIVVEAQPMYNFTVDEAHTYFVGEGQWLVHNDCIVPPPGALSGARRASSVDGPPAGLMGIYEYYDQTRNAWYVGKAHDLRERLLAEKIDGRFLNWEDVVYTEIPWYRKDPWGSRSLRAAEQTRILQLQAMYEEVDVRVNQMNFKDLREFYDRGTHIKFGPDWPDWLRLPD